VQHVQRRDCTTSQPRIRVRGLLLVCRYLLPSHNPLLCFSLLRSYFASYFRRHLLYLCPQPSILHSHFHSQPDHYPWQPAWGLYGWPHTPLNAILSGPLVGGPWDAGDASPRAIHELYWDEVCPPLERHIVYTSDLKAPVSREPGRVIFEHMVKTLKELPARCVEVQGSEGDKYPQLYELDLVGNGRVLTLSEPFLHSPTSRLLGPSGIVSSALERNKWLFLPRGPRNIAAPSDPFKRMMAVHIRRGDYEGHCRSLA
jgi:hypothetical protein